MKTLNLLAGQWLLGVALATSATHTFGFKQGLPSPERPFPSQPTHQNITVVAISANHLIYTTNSWRKVSFSTPAMEEVKSFNMRADVAHFDNPEFHFDAERFAGADGSVMHLHAMHSKIVEEMRKPTPDIPRARKLLGFALHTVQDFYAHSNWIEINRYRRANSLGLLKHPSFGSSPDAKIVFADIGLSSADLPSPTAACNRTEAFADGPLTTGYFDSYMTLAGGDRGFSTTAWKEDAQALIAGTQILPPATLADALWPTDRCVHGGDNGSGLNKDTKDRDLVHGAGVFDDATSAATQATRKFVISVFDGINERKLDAPLFNDSGLLIIEPDAATLSRRNRGICLLLGHKPVSDCDESATPPTVTSVVPQSAFALYGSGVNVTVTGSNLPLNAHVEMQDGRCGVPSEQSPTKIMVTCTPGGKPGVKSISVRRYDSQSTPVLGTAEATLLIGVIQDAPLLSLIVERISLTVSWIWDQVKAIVWNFGSDTPPETSVVANGVSTPNPRGFNTSGEKTVLAKFIGDIGAILGTSSVTINVLPAVVDTVVSPPVTLGTSLTFIVRGSNLPQGLGFSLDGCLNIKEIGISGSPSERRFTCTFATSAAAGIKVGAIGVNGSVAGSPFAVLLKEFQVNLAVAPVEPRITSAIEITPTAPVVGDTITFIARGEGLLNTGWMFKFSGMDYCGRPGATPTLISATELRYSCTATAPTNLLGTVAVTSSDLVSQHGSAVLVRVGCPTGSVLNTQTAQCQADAGGNLKLGLVGHWSFDTCDAKDSSPNALHGVVSGAPVCVTGKSGKALRFNGATDWITVPSSASFPSQAVTFSYWLHREGNAVIGNLQNYLSKEIAFQSYLMPNAALTAGLWLGTTGFWSEHGSTPSTLPTLTDWVHFAFTYDNATRTAKNYVNGVLVETTVNAYANAVVRQSPYPLYIGRNGSANVYWIKGLLDEVRVYDRVLSAADVLALQQGTGSNTAGSSLLPPTGAHSAQCFIAGSGSGNVQSCVGADALALSGAGKQDGMILRNFNYAELPRAGGGNFARTECVYDGFTGFVWEGKTADGGARDGSKATYTDAGDGRASDAAAYVAQVNSIALCGFTDWRVPNIAELQSIVHYGMGSSRPAIDLAWFPNSQGGYGTYYRTSTPYRIPYVDRDKFVLSLWDGAANWAFNERGHHLRLVRGGNSAVAGSRFVEQAGGSEVLDSATGLVWSRCDVGQTWAGNACVGAALLVTHEAALAHVKAIAGWRLPNIKELVSIVNFTRASPAVDIAVFPQTPQQPHWTSTAFVDGGSAWGVDFNSALFGPNGRFYAQPFRLVRAQ